jgi:hypothetical protein
MPLISFGVWPLIVTPIIVLIFVLVFPVVIKWHTITPIRKPI